MAHLGNLDPDGRITEIIRGVNYNVFLATGFSGHYFEDGNQFLCRKSRVICWPAERQLASPGLSSITFPIFSKYNPAFRRLCCFFEYKLWRRVFECYSKYENPFSHIVLLNGISIILDLAITRLPLVRNGILMTPIPVNIKIRSGQAVLRLYFCTAGRHSQY